MSMTKKHLPEEQDEDDDDDSETSAIRMNSMRKKGRMLAEKSKRLANQSGKKVKNTFVNIKDKLVSKNIKTAKGKEDRSTIKSLKTIKSHMFKKPQAKKAVINNKLPKNLEDNICLP